MGFPVKFKVYGLYEAVSNDVVFYCWDWQVFIKRKNGPYVYERRNSISYLRLSYPSIDIYNNFLEKHEQFKLFFLNKTFKVKNFKILLSIECVWEVILC